VAAMKGLQVDTPIGKITSARSTIKPHGAYVGRLA